MEDNPKKFYNGKNNNDFIKDELQKILDIKEEFSIKKSNDQIYKHKKYVSYRDYYI